MDVSRISRSVVHRSGQHWSDHRPRARAARGFRAVRGRGRCNSVSRIDHRCPQGIENFANEFQQIEISGQGTRVNFSNCLE